MKGETIRSIKKSTAKSFLREIVCLRAFLFEKTNQVNNGIKTIRTDCFVAIDTPRKKQDKYRYLEQCDSKNRKRQKTPRRTKAKRNGSMKVIIDRVNI